MAFSGGHGLEQGRHDGSAPLPFSSSAGFTSPSSPVVAQGGPIRPVAAQGRPDPATMMADLLREPNGAAGSDGRRCCTWMGLAGLIDGLCGLYRRAH